MKLTAPKTLFKMDRFMSRRWIPELGRQYRDWSRRISRELDVERRAREAGRDNLPAGADTKLDAVQQQIVNRFDTGADSLRQGLWNMLKGADDLVQQRIPEPLDPDAVMEQAEVAAVRIRDRARDNLIALRKTERERHRDLQLFKAENGLVRTASYPSPRPPLMSIFLLLVVLVFETALNATIFAEASPGYLRDGAIQATTFSLVNLSLGFGLLGLVAARYAGHRKAWRRYAGIVGIAFAVALGVGFNAYVAHYREILQSIPLDQIDALSSASYADALAHLREDPFGLTSWQAIVLFAIGLAIFAGLAVKGYLGYDDVYPGYGRTDRTHKKALRAYKKAQAAFKAEVESAIDAATKRVSDRLAAETRAVEQARDIAAEASQAQREVADSAADLARAATDNLRTYREANVFVRSDAPPAYYKEYPAFSVELPEMAAISERLIQAIAARDANSQAANRLGSMLNRFSAEQVDSFLAWIEDIENEAARLAKEDRIDSRPPLLLVGPGAHGSAGV